MIDFSRAGASTANSLQSNSRRDVSGDPLLGFGEVGRSQSKEPRLSENDPSRTEPSFAKQLSQSQPSNRIPPTPDSRNATTKQSNNEIRQSASPKPTPYRISDSLKSRLGLESKVSKNGSEIRSERLEGEDERDLDSPTNEQQAALRNYLNFEQVVDAAKPQNSNSQWFREATDQSQPNPILREQIITHNAQMDFVRQRVPEPANKQDQNTITTSPLANLQVGNFQNILRETNIPSGDSNPPMGANAFVEHFQDGITHSPIVTIDPQSHQSLAISKSLTPRNALFALESSSNPQALGYEPEFGQQVQPRKIELLNQVDQLSRSFDAGSIEWIVPQSPVEPLIGQSIDQSPEIFQGPSSFTPRTSSQPVPFVTAAVSSNTEAGLQSQSHTPLSPPFQSEGIGIDNNSPRILDRNFLLTREGQMGLELSHSISQMSPKFGAREFALAERMTQPINLDRSFQSNQRPIIDNPINQQMAELLGSSKQADFPVSGQKLGQPIFNSEPTNFITMNNTAVPVVPAANSILNPKNSSMDLTSDSKPNATKSPIAEQNNLAQASETESTAISNISTQFEEQNQNSSSNSNGISIKNDSAMPTNPSQTAGGGASSSKQSWSDDQGSRKQDEVNLLTNAPTEKALPVRDSDFSLATAPQEPNSNTHFNGSLDNEKLSERAARSFTRAVQQRVIDVANRMVVQGATGQARIKLQDSSLGAVDILVSVSGDKRVAIDLQTDSSELKNRIESKLDDIRDGLQSQKFQSVDIKVVADSQTGTSMDSNSKGQQQRDSSSQNPSGDQGRSFQQSSNGSPDSGGRNGSQETARSTNNSPKMDEHLPDPNQIQKYSRDSTTGVNLKGNINVRA